MLWTPRPSRRLDESNETAREPFIPTSSESKHDFVDRDTRPEERRWLCSPKVALISHCSLILFYTAVFLVFIRYNTHCPSSADRPMTWSPAEHVLKWEMRPVDGHRNDSIYVGRPGPEVDAAWHDLLQNINIRILPEEQARLSQDSLALADGSGYLGVLAVYHELHCLKRLRWWMYREHYYPAMTAEEELEHMTHADHCLELMRQVAVCQADTTVTPFHWLHSGRGPYGVEPTTREGVAHRCAEWAPIEEWASSRRVDLFDPKLLVPPTEAERGNRE